MYIYYTTYIYILHICYIFTVYMLLGASESGPLSRFCQVEAMSHVGSDTGHRQVGTHGDLLLGDWKV